MKLERISRIKGNWNVLRARGKKKRIHNLRAHLGVVQVGGTLQRLCKDSAKTLHQSTHFPLEGRRRRRGRREKQTQRLLLLAYLVNFNNVITKKLKIAPDHLVSRFVSDEIRTNKPKIENHPIGSLRMK